MPEPLQRPILFYDGTCGMCTASVQWFMARDHRAVLLFAPLQGSTYAALEADPKPMDLDTIVLADSRGVHLRSEAVLRALVHIGGVWGTFGAVSLVVPRAIRDAVYRFIAKRRHAIAGTADSCPLPTESQRARMLP